jgi:hypothetical protein
MQGTCVRTSRSDEPTGEAFKLDSSKAVVVVIQSLEGGGNKSRSDEAAGIKRRHSTRNRPQQNGLAERANRTMGERITAMLSESRLPPSFWGECISSMVHVWNKLFFFFFFFFLKMKLVFFKKHE